MIIVVKNDDGSCSIVHPEPEMFDINSRTRQNLAAAGHIFKTDEEILDFIIDLNNLQGKNYRIASKSILPANKDFRAAWTDDLDTDTVDIDIQKAKEIHKNTLRALRKPVLDKLDVEYMKADEAGDEEGKKSIAQKKQSLRDITSLEMPSDLTELKNFIPDILKNG